MTTRIINVFANLETEFEEAQKGLKDVDDSIKRITGREPGFVKSKMTIPVRTPRAIPNMPTTMLKMDPNLFADEPPRKRRFIGSAFSRVYAEERNRQFQQEPEPVIRKPTLQSSVIATPRETKQRTQALEEQKGDKKNMARNKRMFGMILGTLQKFQTEESRRKDTTQKRFEIEKKLDLAAEEEKEAVKKERRELFLVRREKQAQIRRIEHKMERVEIHNEWEKSHQFLGNFIQTKTKPPIFYLPKTHTPETEKKLQESRDKFRLIVAEKRAKVQKELAEIDDLYKKSQAELEAEEMAQEMENLEDLAEEDTNEMISDNANVIDDSSSQLKVESEQQESVEQTESNVFEDPANGHQTNNNNEELQESLGDKEFEPIYDE